MGASVAFLAFLKMASVSSRFPWTSVTLGGRSSQLLCSWRGRVSCDGEDLKVGVFREQGRDDAATLFASGSCYQQRARHVCLSGIWTDRVAIKRAMWKSGWRRG